MKLWKKGKYVIWSTDCKRDWMASQKSRQLNRKTLYCAASCDCGSEIPSAFMVCSHNGGDYITFYQNYVFFSIFCANRLWCVHGPSLSGRSQMIHERKQVRAICAFHNGASYLYTISSTCSHHKPAYLIPRWMIIHVLSKCQPSLTKRETYMYSYPSFNSQKPFRGCVYFPNTSLKSHLALEISCPGMRSSLRDHWEALSFSVAFLSLSHSGNYDTHVNYSYPHGIALVQKVPEHG